MMAYGYKAEEECFRALMSLALTEGDLRERLGRALVDFAIAWQQEEDWPPDMWSAVQELRQAVTRYQPRPQGAIRDTLAQMDDDELRRWTIRLIDICTDVMAIAYAEREARKPPRSSAEIDELLRRLEGGDENP
jgi:hypothetical protein